MVACKLWESRQGITVRSATACATSSHPTDQPGVAYLETPSSATAIPYGSGAPSSTRSSIRDRDRRERSLSHTEQEPGHPIIRTWLTSPQEAVDWAAALDTMVNRVVTLERVNRCHAQLIAHENERAVELNNKMNALVQVVQNN